MTYKKLLASSVMPSTRFLYRTYFFLFASAVLFPIAFLAKFKLHLFGFSVGAYHVFFMALSLMLFISAWLKTARPREELIPFLFFPLALAFSTFFSVNRHVSLEASIRFIVQGISIACFIQMTMTADHLPGFTKKLTLILFLAALIGIMEHRFGESFIYHGLYKAAAPEALQELSARGNGIVGTVGHPLPFAILIAMFVPLTLASDWPLPIKACFVFAMLYALVIAESRASVISALLGVSCYFILAAPRKLEIKNKIIPALIIIALAFATYKFLQRWYGGHYNYGLWIESHRFGAYKAAFAILAQYPFFGLGMNNYPETIKNFLEPGMSAVILTPDNQYLRWISETGITGLCCVFLFVTQFLRKIPRALEKPETYKLTAACLGGLAGTAWALLFLDGLMWVPIQLSFWSLVGCCLALASKKPAALC